MKKLTTLEMTLPTCPKCLTDSDGTATRCSQCGQYLVVKEQLLEDIDESIMPEAEKRRYPQIESPIFPYGYPGNYTSSIVAAGFLILLFIVFTLLLLAKLGAKTNGKTIPHILFVLMLVVTLIILIYAPVIFPTRVLRVFVRQWRNYWTTSTGHFYEAKILGYGKRNISRRRRKMVLHGTMSVLAEIGGRETIITILTPIGVSKLTHPVGEHVNIVGRGRNYTLCR